jgi:hypothetical protein
MAKNIRSGRTYKKSRETPAIAPIARTEKITSSTGV